MKPLNEVIEEAERCQLPFPGDCGNCPYFDDTMETDSCMGKIIAEALEHLKMYQQEKGSLINARALTEEAYEKHSRWIENCRKAYEEMTERACKYREAEEELGAQKAQMMWVNKHFAFEEPNNPLTWEELREMEGKPVWIEDRFGSGEWYIVRNVYGDRTASLNDKWGKDLIVSEWRMKDTWQAYRKERS